MGRATVRRGTCGRNSGQRQSSVQIRELEHALRQSGVSVLVHARQFRRADYVAMREIASAEVGLGNDVLSAA
jgi:hypothetical protein